MRSKCLRLRSQHYLLLLRNTYIYFLQGSFGSVTNIEPILQYEYCVTDNVIVCSFIGTASNLYTLIKETDVFGLSEMVVLLNSACEK